MLPCTLQVRAFYLVPKVQLTPRGIALLISAFMLEQNSLTHLIDSRLNGHTPTVLKLEDGVSDTTSMGRKGGGGGGLR